MWLMDNLSQRWISCGIARFECFDRLNIARICDYNGHFLELFEKILCHGLKREAPVIRDNSSVVSG